jgi:hypothetical protein
MLQVLVLVLMLLLVFMVLLLPPLLLLFLFMLLLLLLMLMTNPTQRTLTNSTLVSLIPISSKTISRNSATPSNST